MAQVEQRPAGRLRNSRQVGELQQVMTDVDSFRTAGELFDETRQRGLKIGIATIYRNLKLFAENGMADTVHREDGEVQYRLCRRAADPAEPADHHHHHVVCRECGASVEVEAPAVEEWAERVAAAAGFTEVSHTVEIFGRCPRHSGRR